MEATSAADAEAKQKSKDAWNEILRTPPLTDSHVLARKRVLRKTPEGKRKKVCAKVKTVAIYAPKTINPVSN